MSKTVSARIPDDLYDRLQATAQALGVSVSQLVSQAIAAHVNTVNMAYTAGIPRESEQTPVNISQTAVNSLSTPVNRDPNLTG